MRAFILSIYAGLFAVMLEINPLLNLIKDLRERSNALRGYL
jgi:hypothetical protein